MIFSHFSQPFLVSVSYVFCRSGLGTPLVEQAFSFLAGLVISRYFILIVIKTQQAGSAYHIHYTLHLKSPLHEIMLGGARTCWVREARARVVDVSRHMARLSPFSLAFSTLEYLNDCIDPGGHYCIRFVLYICLTELHNPSKAGPSRLLNFRQCTSHLHSCSPGWQFLHWHTLKSSSHRVSHPLLRD